MDRKQLAIIAVALAAVIVSAFIYWRSVHRTAVRRYPNVAVNASRTRPVAAARKALPAIEKKFGRPKVAVVMDDFGNNDAYLGELFAIGEPVTLSVLPELKYSKKTSGEALSRGYEVMLHLPLEAKGGQAKEEPDTIRSGMSKADILDRLGRETSTVPGISGMSNHMGSRATGDRAVMDAIMSYLKKNGLYFFDSMTSPDSVCGRSAASAGVRYAKRDVFLDVENNVSYIEKQLLELRRLAHARGSAIAVCHYRPVTIKALAKMMPSMASDGIEFVKLSALVK